jgi:3D-(3,5/4)-trihydroxycyclohexane-1,2-dione acylhydrolase (decyclizing)
VTVALPQDVQGEAYDYPVEFLEKRVHHVERRIPSAAQVARAVAMISKAKRPYVICGGGVRYSGAGQELQAFCEQFHVPFAETQGGKGCVAWDDPHNLSGIGTTGALAANRLAKDADLIIALGTRLGDFTTCSKWLFQNPDCRVLGINVAAFDAYKMNSEPIIADAKLATAAITEALAATGYRSAWGETIQKERAIWQGKVDALYGQSEAEAGGLSQVRCLGELNDHLLPRDAIVVSGSGSIPSDMQRIWRTRTPGTYHMEYGFSCMGYEVAAALGVKLAAPGQEVVAVMGDGAYTMLHTELLTAVQEGRKIIVVVLDNSGYQCIDNLQISQGIIHFGNEWRKREAATGRLTGASLQVDYAKNAESWGALGLRASTVEEFRSAVRAALAADGPVLIDAKVTTKSMTGNYESWWRVGTAQVSENPAVVQAAEDVQAHVANARKF